jgi:hypothetical protein
MLRGNNRHDRLPSPKRGFKMKLSSCLWECAMKTEQSSEAWNTLVGSSKAAVPSATFRRNLSVSMRPARHCDGGLMKTPASTS